ncbi:MucR family transcriptional regulator [Methylobacterium frigidaeris]|uniref:Transcriptional regulatory protein ros n=1 Tax=Methylobacterium frigidaeris TaxID=2038277 RepID=A0AA37HD54_9HYPH|nr:MucR family transcriptional regulator [Methylobacterium frigidaeris]PIK73117.1 MucR family transcriptional regulator [Methylobacterium frigidaeris]GJD63770.1 Transcriptional regulatory protein ros [Methylobacterium frigidaeris]
MSDHDANPLDFVALAGSIVSAYVAHNSVPAADLPGLIASVHGALAGLGAPAAPEPVKLEPPVPIRKTVTPDHIISLEDGKPYRTLKRHLAGRGLTPEQYREKWGLPRDYPMVAANYAAQRSELAKNSGLGRKGIEARAKPKLVGQAA